MFSNPSVSLMLSTTVSICGNVLSTCSGFNPRSNGTYRFGSKVSVCAIPPAIQRTITVSAVGLGFSSLPAQTCRGKPAPNAESVAALAVLRKSRRLHSTRVLIRLIYQLKFGQHNHRPKQVLHPITSRRFANNPTRQLHLPCRRLAPERLFIDLVKELARSETRANEQLLRASFQDIGQRHAIRQF